MNRIMKQLKEHKNRGMGSDSIERGGDTINKSSKYSAQNSNAFNSAAIANGAPVHANRNTVPLHPKTPFETAELSVGNNIKKKGKRKIKLRKKEGAGSSGGGTLESKHAEESLNRNGVR